MGSLSGIEGPANWRPPRGQRGMSPGPHASDWAPLQLPDGRLLILVAQEGDRIGPGAYALLDAMMRVTLLQGHGNNVVATRPVRGAPPPLSLAARQLIALIKVGQIAPLQWGRLHATTGSLPTHLVEQCGIRPIVAGGGRAAVDLADPGIIAAAWALHTASTDEFVAARVALGRAAWRALSMDPLLKARNEPA